MINSEPKIKVALLQYAPEARLQLTGSFLLPDGHAVTGRLSARAADGQVVLLDSNGLEIIRRHELLLTPDAFAKNFFTVLDIKIGIDFHWQRVQEQSFRGALLLSGHNETTFHLINIIPLEEYLASVISSEMSAEAPLEFLKAQAVTARSWLIAMLAKKKSPRTLPEKKDDEILVWQDVNDHQEFDVCADDHCQRYQGITRIISDQVARAIDATRGTFLTSAGEICDARYYKCCGGQTDVFSSAWENESPPYLQSITDSGRPHPPVSSETDAADWLFSTPPAYCNTTDKALLGRILPAFDQETPNFYRWQVTYTRQELEAILKKKSGIDFGELRHIIPLERGPSGRIYKLKITGSQKSVIVGKELEIRRWLSESHLFSSAFVVISEHAADGGIQHFIFHGGGWGHGVGLCQIGAAVMAAKGHKTEEILAHYFTGAILRKFY
ncbi:MAG: amidase [Deltaproteobacteria bacterium HGW-Deltaproteobacteria-6]|jgi:peptidoglycan hydrolase-like amidase|nr:MAG: amidase [Deltaproteobacteria bacterium HGW-Deltaproteobacteria-6]